MKQLVLIVASDIYLNARASCSYLWTDFAKIWHEWSSHQWELTETVRLMITHIFRRPGPTPPQDPLSPNLYFSNVWPILIGFGINGPHIKGKRLIQLN